MPALIHIYFTHLLTVSLVAGAAIALIALVSRLLGNRYSASWRYMAWLLLAVWLVVPVTLSLPQAPLRIPLPDASIIQPAHDNTAALPAANTFEPQPSVTGTVEDDLVDKSAGQGEAGTTTSPTANAGAEGESMAAGSTLWPELTEYMQAITLMDALVMLWLVGFVAALMYRVIQTRRFRAWLGRSWQPCENELVIERMQQTMLEMGWQRKVELRICSEIPSPFTVGLLRPVLVLPHLDYDAAVLAFIIRHELTHCQRWDLWYKALINIASAVHWFNPLVLLMRRYSSRDMELVCDDIVVRGQDHAGRRSYANSVLSTALLEKDRMPAALTTSFSSGANEVKARLESIVSTQPKRSGALALLLIMTMAVLASCGTVFGGGSSDSDGLDADEPPVYELPEYYAAYDNDAYRWGFIDASGEWVIPPVYPMVMQFSEGLASVMDAETGLYGFIDADGDWVIAPQYKSTGFYNEGLAPAGDYATGLMGCIDHEGNWVFQPKYTYILPLVGGYAVAGIDNNDLDSNFTRIVINRQGIEVYRAPDGWTISSIIVEDGRLIIENASSEPGIIEQQIVDLNGNILYEITFDIRESIIGFYPLSFVPRLAGLTPFFDQASGLFGYVDKDFSWVIEPRYQLAGNFYHGLSRVQDAETSLYGYINESGDWVIEPQFQQARDFIDVLAFAQASNGLWGVIDQTGQWIIAPTLSCSDSAMYSGLIVYFDSYEFRMAATSPVQGCDFFFNGDLALITYSYDSYIEFVYINRQGEQVYSWIIEGEQSLPSGFDFGFH